MLSLYDIVQQAMAGTGKSGSPSLGFDLTPAQSERALAALIPAFSLGLKRASQDPQSLIELMQLLAKFSGPKNHAPGTALDMEALNASRESLGILFGSSDSTKTIADHASSLANVPSEKILEMMPSLASTIMSGLQDSMPIKEGPAPDLLTAFIEGFERGRPEPKPEPDFSPEAATDILNSFFTGFQRGRDGEKGEAAQPEESAEPAEEKQESTLDSLFNAGDQIQKSNMDAMQTMFDKLYGAAKKD